MGCQMNSNPSILKGFTQKHGRKLRSLGKEKAIDQSTLQGEYIGREGAFILDVHR